jgi:SnoaL-like domain
MPNGDLERMLDQLAVERVAREIDRAVDEKNWAAMRRQVADKLTVDIGVVSGTEIIEMTGDEFVEEIAALNVAEKASYHVHNDALVTIEADTAALTAHSYGWNYCKRFEQSLYEVWGTMRYRFVREGGRWLVRHVSMEKWREAGNPDVSVWRGK